MDKQIIETKVRLCALEYMVAHVHAALYRSLRLSRDQIEALHHQATETFRNQTVPGLDPAQSDLVAAEMQAALEAHLKMIEEMMGMGGRLAP